MNRKTLLLISVLVLLLVLSGCRKEDQILEGTGYGITHKDYVGVAKIKVKDGVVEDLTLNEVLLPSTWAEISIGTDVPEDVVVADGKWYAKYIVIGDRNFTGTVRDEPLTEGAETFTKQTVKYSSDDIEDLYLWLRQPEDNSAWYAQKLLDNEAHIAKSDWSKANYQLKVNGFTKRDIDYWPSSEGSIGWKGNMEAISAALKGTKMDASENLVRNDDGYWSINGVKSGATLVDFKDYYKVALRAYNNALANND